MKFAKISAVAVAMTVFAAAYQPAQAFVAKPAPVAPQATAGDVIEVGRRGYRRGYRRGFRGYRRGYRRGRNRAIVGGLVAGALIGSVLAAPRYYDRPRYRRYYDAPRRVYRPRRVRGRSHVNWCYNRYRSYRASDNTFQPYHGPRRACFSPYR